ncbi:MAG: hypothetical protein OMM_09488 [Candidatus Magnetoglobus multicellularis str. Araruama]|uniref:Uncharacterized protein n=1 Tax=Candidatus Magnetoglobus multicellularis str. Araruama TaxID=890399 RepID=A0A1V1P438_9BACT|nr:MAG: hypothetical protein OMM_09488 [Candidatus Magnetoglobus multicellularis str. Araruama]
MFNRKIYQNGIIIMKKELIDRDKLRRDIKKLRRADLLILLDRAIEHLPETRLPEVFQNSIDFDKTKFNESKNIQKDFLPKIKNFIKQAFVEIIMKISMLTPRIIWKCPLVLRIGLVNAIICSTFV